MAGKHGVDHYVTDSEHHALVALAWHDVVCPEGPECPDRPAHAAAQQLASSGQLSRFLNRLSELELQEAIDAQSP